MLSFKAVMMSTTGFTSSSAAMTTSLPSTLAWIISCTASWYVSLISMSPRSFNMESISDWASFNSSSLTSVSARPGTSSIFRKNCGYRTL